MDKPDDDRAQFNYQLLGRLQQDCDYYLGYGNRAKKHLWAGDEVEQIAKMKELYDGFNEKPEWITLEDIARYEAAMINAIPRSCLVEDLSKCPQCGGEADRGVNNCVPPSAYMCSKCCAQEEAEKVAVPPAGFILVHEGLRQDGDMRWSHFDQRWTLVYSDSMSERIEDFDFPCARKLSK